MVSLAGLSRREALERLGLGGAAMLAGCNLGPWVCGDGEPPPAALDEASTARRALLAHVDTVIVVMLENRSFDHLLGALRTDPAYPGRDRIEGLRGDEQNPDTAGRPVFVSRMPGDGRGHFNPAHAWAAVRRTFNGGRNDRFVIENAGPHQHEVMSFLTREQVPYLHELAGRFTVCDRWFASFMGQTWPNRYYLHAATSGGRRENKPLGLSAPATIWEGMASRCLPAKNYAAGAVHWYTVAFPTKVFSGNDAMVPATIDEFFRDARAGTLPALAVIDPDFKFNDAYPMHDLALTEAFVASIVRAVAESPQWARSLLVVTFDEHGGYYDHVPPPLTVDPRPDFRQLGFRVPALVVGPHVWRGGVVSTRLDHTAIASTLRTRFGIASLGARMDATPDLSVCIDPAALLAPAPPPRNLPAVELSERHLTGAEPTSSQGELEQALDARAVPSDRVDPRSGEERLRAWLRNAQELEAVKVRG